MSAQRTFNDASFPWAISKTKEVVAIFIAKFHFTDNLQFINIKKGENMNTWKTLYVLKDKDNVTYTKMDCSAKSIKIKEKCHAKEHTALLMVWVYHRQPRDIIRSRVHTALNKVIPGVDPISFVDVDGRPVYVLGRPSVSGSIQAFLDPEVRDGVFNDT